MQSFSPRSDRSQRVGLERTLAVIVTLVLCLTVTFAAAPGAEAQDAVPVDGVVTIAGVAAGDITVETDDASTTTGSDGSFSLSTTPEVKLVTLSSEATPAYPALPDIPRFSLSTSVDFGEATTPGCPEGFEPDASLGGLCARFEPASQGPATCPAGARGVPGACYILVAKNPQVGGLVCVQGTLVGTNCVIVGDPPVRGPATCPVSATVLLDGAECYTLIARPVTPGSCAAPYVQFGGVCKANNTGTTQAEIVSFVCPATPGGETVTQNMHVTGGITKIESCEYTPDGELGTCPVGTTFDPNGTDCRRPVDLVPGALTCAPGFGLVNGECIRYEDPIVTGAQCVEGTLVGNTCVIVGDPPVQGPPTCPVSATVIQQGAECYTLIARPMTPGSCAAPYVQFGGVCKANNTGTTQAEIVSFICPAPPSGETVTQNMHVTGGITKIESCEYTPTGTPGACPAGTTPDPNGTDCRRPVDLRPGALTCAPNFGLINGECIRYEMPVLAGAICVDGTLVGNNCVIVGDPPVPGPATCPVSATVLLDGSECYTLIARPMIPGSCAAPYVQFGGVCKANNTGTTQVEVVAFICPAPPGGETVTQNMHVTGGITKIESCEYTPDGELGACPVGTTFDPNGTDCRRPVDLVPGAPMCAAGFGLINGECIRYEDPVLPAAQCPTGSLEDAEGNCRKPVADAAGVYFCEDPTAALNGVSCVFIADPIAPAPLAIDLPELVDLEILVTGGYYSNCDYAGAIDDPCVIDDFCTPQLAAAGECDEVYVEVLSLSSAGQFAGRWHVWGDTVDNSVVLPTFADSTGVIIRVSTLDAGSEEFAWDGNNPTTIDLDGGSDPALWYIDADEDGFGDSDSVGTVDFPAGSEASYDNSDCDDTAADINPLAFDIPNNSIDENCDGSDAISTISFTGTVFAGDQAIEGAGIDGDGTTDANGEFSVERVPASTNESVFVRGRQEGSQWPDYSTFIDNVDLSVDQHLDVEFAPVEQLEIRLVRETCRDNPTAPDCAIPLDGHQVRLTGNYDLDTGEDVRFFSTSIFTGTSTLPFLAADEFTNFEISVRVPEPRLLTFEWDGNNPTNIFLPVITEWYPDVDGDFYGDDDADPIISPTSPGPGFVGRAGDCDDTNRLISPIAFDIEFNGIDENCDGQDNEPPLVRITGQISVGGQGTDQIHPLTADGRRWTAREDGTFGMLFPTESDAANFMFESDASPSLPAIATQTLFNPRIERRVDLELPAIEFLEVQVFDNHLADDCSLAVAICGDVVVQTLGSFGTWADGTWTNPASAAPGGTIVQPVFVNTPAPAIEIWVDGEASVYEWDGSNPFLIDLSQPLPTCFGLPVTIDMTRGHDGIGTPGDDVIWGTTGNDLIRGRGGNDVICSLGGDDDVNGGTGDDLIGAGLGDDRVVDRSGNNEVRSGSGHDVVIVGNGVSSVFAGSGDDIVVSYAGDHFLYGGPGADRLIGDDSNETMYGGNEDDVLIGRGGVNVLRGGPGFDGCWFDPGSTTQTGQCEYGSTNIF